MQAIQQVLAERDAADPVCSVLAVVQEFFSTQDAIARFDRQEFLRAEAAARDWHRATELCSPLMPQHTPGFQARFLRYLFRRKVRFPVDAVEAVDLMWGGWERDLGEPPAARSAQGPSTRYTPVRWRP